jgi:DnaJ-class molecular chaperone
VDDYRILQVSRDAEPEVIEKAYKALCMKYHPDRAAAGERAHATARMQRINQAYAVLSDPAARARYDRTLPARQRGGGHGWERFMDAGLLGLFMDWYDTRPERSG